MYLKNHDYYVRQNDFQILKNLNNISIGTYISDDLQYEKVTVYFTFDQNEFFTNKELKVSLSYTGKYVDKSQGTVINWTKNPTVRFVKKRQKNKKTGETRIINQKIQERSFFEIFEDLEDEAEFLEGESEK